MMKKMKYLFKRLVDWDNDINYNKSMYVSDHKKSLIFVHLGQCLNFFRG